MKSFFAFAALSSFAVGCLAAPATQTDDLVARDGAVAIRNAAAVRNTAAVLNTHSRDDTDQTFLANIVISLIKDLNSNVGVSLADISAIPLTCQAKSNWLISCFQNRLDSERR